MQFEKMIIFQYLFINLGNSSEPDYSSTIENIPNAGLEEFF